MPLLTCQETVDRAYPSRPITKEALIKGRKHWTKFRGSVRIASARVMTAADLKAREENLQKDGLP